MSWGGTPKRRNKAFRGGFATNNEAILIEISMMRFTMTNVLQQAAISMLANQLPNNLLQLLR